jgi:hypothetical protein
MPIRLANVGTSGTLFPNGVAGFIHETKRTAGETDGTISPVSIVASIEAGTTFSASLNASGNFNLRHSQQKSLYDRLLQGSALRSEVGEASDGSGIPYASQKATSPSWTQHTVGYRHGFVHQAFSSSFHEKSTLNAYVSGTMILESSIVPASGTAYYSKRTAVKHLIYKLSASVNLPQIPASSSRPPSNAELTITRVTGSSGFFPVSGCFRANDIFNPSVFEIHVPEHGKIRDIKVWVEFIHDHRGGIGAINSLYQTAGTASSDQDRSVGLQSVVVALRSPNTNFSYAHPLWNSPSVNNFLKRTYRNLDEAFAGYGHGPAWHGGFDGDESGTLPVPFMGVPEIFRNSYLLWSGHSAEYDLFNVFSDYLAAPYTLPYYREFDTDIDMRTIFTDGSPIPNPRNLTFLYPNASDKSPGNGLMLTSITGTTEAVIFDGASVSNGVYVRFSNTPYHFPTRYLAENFLTASTEGWSFGVTGSGVPWMLDDRIPMGRIHRTQALDHTVTGYGFLGPHRTTVVATSSSPPEGWLTGPNGTANTNEFATKGMNMGPNTIQPVYPLLDDIYVTKKFLTDKELVDNYGSNDNYEIIDPYFDTGIIGHRPGLRGTEVHGTWKLMIGLTADYQGGFGMRVRPRGGIWFRQFRLEFIIEQGEDATLTPQTRRRYRTTSHVEKRPGTYRFMIMSGSSEWDRGINYVYRVQPDEYGRTIGITDHTGSNISNFAVFTRVTGALADMLTGSQHAGARYSFLNNEFGTPYIPLSSGSGTPVSFNYFGSNHRKVSNLILSNVLRPTPIIKGMQTLKSITSRTRDFYQTTLDRREYELNRFIDSDGVILTSSLLT